MSDLVHANSFRELIVYQKEKVLAGEIFLLTRYFSRDETYPLADQSAALHAPLERRLRKPGITTP